MLQVYSCEVSKLCKADVCFYVVTGQRGLVHLLVCINSAAAASKQLAQVCENYLHLVLCSFSVI